MNVPLYCPQCGYSMVFPEERLAAMDGKPAKCRNCSKVFQVRRAGAPLPLDIPEEAAGSAAPPDSDPSPLEYQCSECSGWFGAANVYSVEGGYLCHRCHSQRAAYTYTPASSPPPVVIRHTVPGRVYPQWSPGVAALLSFFMPGTGQMYKGQVGAGVGWLIAVFAGYCCLVVPGIILHICCIVSAASGDPRR